MELKIWVDGLPRTISGITYQTTCQEVILALAQMRGLAGRYVLVEKGPNSERQLAPAEKPLLVLQKWGEHSKYVHFALRFLGASPQSLKQPLSATVATTSESPFSSPSSGESGVSSDVLEEQFKAWAATRSYLTDRDPGYGSLDRRLVRATKPVYSTTSGTVGRSQRFSHTDWITLVSQQRNKLTQLVDQMKEIDSQLGTVESERSRMLSEEESKLASLLNDDDEGELTRLEALQTSQRQTEEILNAEITRQRGRVSLLETQISDQLLRCRVLGDKLGDSEKELRKNLHEEEELQEKLKLARDKQDQVSTIASEIATVEAELQEKRRILAGLETSVIVEDDTVIAARPPIWV